MELKGSISQWPADRPWTSRGILFLLGCLMTTAFAPFGFTLLVPLLLLPLSFRGAVGGAPFTHPVDRMHAVGGEGERAGAPVLGLGIGLAIVSLPAYSLCADPLRSLGLTLVLAGLVAWSWAIRERTPFPPPPEESE